MQEKTIELTPFLRLLNAVQILHWGAHKHSHHVVLGDCYKAFAEKIDEIVEYLKGMEADLNSTYGDIPMHNVDPSNPYENFRALYKEFSNAVEEYSSASAYKSLMDDMEVIADRCAYLLRMD